MLPKFTNPLSSNNQSTFNTSNGGNQPDKKMILFGGGLVLILIVLGLLLFGGGNNNGQAWQNLINNETQITVVGDKYDKDLTDSHLQDATATTMITWQSNNNDVEAIYATNVGKGAKRPSRMIDKKLATSLDSAKVAGNLDSVFAASLIKQLNQVKTNIRTLSNGNLGSKTKTQLQNTNKQADYTIKLMQPFTNPANADQNSGPD